MKITTIESDVPYLMAPEDFDLIREARFARDYTKIHEVCDGLIATGQSNADVLWWKGYAYECQHDYVAAEDHWMRSMRSTHPLYSEAVNSLDRLYRITNQPAKANELDRMIEEDCDASHRPD